MAEREASVTLRTRKFIRNPLLSRRQMVVYVLPEPLHIQFQPHRHTTDYLSNLTVMSSTQTDPMSPKTNSALSSQKSIKPIKTKCPSLDSGHNMVEGKAQASRSSTTHTRR